MFCSAKFAVMRAGSTTMLAAPRQNENGVQQLQRSVIQTTIQTHQSPAHLRYSHSHMCLSCTGQARMRRVAVSRSTNISYDLQMYISELILLSRTFGDPLAMPDR